MFVGFGSRSRNKSGTPNSHGSSTVGPEDADQLMNDTSHQNDSRPQAETVAEASTPPAKRLRITDAFDKTENEIIANPLYLEPGAKFPIQLLTRTQKTEMADLKFLLDSLEKRHESKILELELILLKNQKIIDSQDFKIDDLEKSLIFLSNREKDFGDQIKSLEKENHDLKQSLLASQGSEALLKDEICVLKEKAVEDEHKIEHLQSNEEFLKKEMDIEISLLNEKKELLEKKIEACEKAFSISKVEVKAERASNAEESIFVTMNRELNNIQNQCTELHEYNLSLSSKIAALMGNQDKYKILCEKYSTLERKSGEYESEIYDLQKKLSQVELHTKSWVDFFSEHEEFDSIDSLWVKYSNCQEQLKALTENQKKSGEESKQLEQQIHKLKGELQLATENTSSVSKLLSEVRNNLLRAEKLNDFAKKENELLKRQLDINFGIAFSSKDQSQAVPQEVLTLLDQTKKLRESLSNEFK